MNRKITYHYFKPGNSNFDKFLNQCKYTMKKSGLAPLGVKYDEWSGYYSNSLSNDHPKLSSEDKKLTVWQGLKKHGTYSSNYSDENGGYAIDFDFENHVYIEIWEVKKEKICSML